MEINPVTLRRNNKQASKRRARSRAFYADQLRKSHEHRPVRTRKADPSDFAGFDEAARDLERQMKGKPVTAKQARTLRRLGLTARDRAEAQRLIAAASS